MMWPASNSEAAESDDIAGEGRDVLQLWWCTLREHHLVTGLLLLLLLLLLGHAWLRSIELSWDSPTSKSSVNAS